MYVTLQNSSDKELVIFWNKWESVVEVGVEQKHEGEGYAVVSNNMMGLDHIERLNIKPKNNLNKEIVIKIKDFIGMVALKFEYRIPPIPISELIGPNQQLWMESATSNTITVQVVEKKESTKEPIVRITDTPLHQKRMSEVKLMAGKIMPGMTRSQVEVWFKTKDGGLQGPSITRYYEDPGVMIDVPYDQTGGNWSKDNRVNGPVKVYADFFHMD